jgi:hypothetical protein
MSATVRSSKFRHVVGTPLQLSGTYGDISPGQPHADSLIVSANAHYFALPWSKRGRYTTSTQSNLNPTQPNTSWPKQRLHRCTVDFAILLTTNKLPSPSQYHHHHTVLRLYLSLEPAQWQKKHHCSTTPTRRATRYQAKPRCNYDQCTDIVLCIVRLIGNRSKSMRWPFHPITITS